MKQAAARNTTGELVVRCQHHEQAAQAELYRRYRQEVARVAYKVLGPNADLEDVVQDVFVEVFRSIERFKGEAKLTTWLYRVCVNVACQRLRRRWRRPEGNGSFLQDELPDHETPLRALERKESAQLVHEILETIAPKKRIVFILHEIVGLESREIARIVESNVLTVRTRLHYARKEFYQRALAIDGLGGGE